MERAVLRIADCVFEQGVGFTNMQWKGVRIGEGTRVKTGSVQADELPEGFNLTEDRGGEYQELSAYVGN